MKRQRWVILGLLLAGWIIILNQPNVVSTRLRAGVVTVITSFLKIGNVIPSVKSRRALQERNDALKAENDRLKHELRQLPVLAHDNLQLRGLLRLANENPSLRVVAARVIGRDASNWWKTIQINTGSQQGVREGQAVVNADGLVGRVLNVTRGESRVLLMADPNCKVSAILQDTRDTGVVVGAPGAFAINPVCRMTFIGRGAKVQPGQVVVTSGLGGVFPRGIPIGVVIQAGLNDQTGMYLDAEVKPAVDFHRLEMVLVLVNE